jgi:hypothetical protein
MAFLSQTSNRQVTARPRFSSLRDVACKATFLVAVGFSAALVFGFIGH